MVRCYHLPFEPQPALPAVEQVYGFTNLPVRVLRDREVVTRLRVTDDLIRVGRALGLNVDLTVSGAQRDTAVLQVLRLVLVQFW